jgi:hypothetical protein
MARCVYAEVWPDGPDIPLPTHDPRQPSRWDKSDAEVAEVVSF